MIIVQLNRQIFEYDVHSLVKSFYPGEDVKIVYETSPEEADAQLVCRLEFLKTVSNFKSEDTLPEQACEKEQVPTSHIRFQIRKNGKTESEETAVCTQPDDRKELKNEVKRLVYRQLSSYTGQKLPWGNLTGIRPTKIPMAMLGQGYRNVEIADYMRKTYYTSNEKTSLAIAIANRERHLLKDINYQNGYSLYVGIPFCPSRCYYCSFVSATTAQSGKLIEPYLDTLCREIEETAALVRAAGKQVQSVYIGGGTPTTLDEHQLARLLSALENHFDFSHLREYTVEAGRPDTITPEKLRVLKSAGVGRVSINPQSMNDAVLAAIGRKHGSADVLRAFDEARQAGFDEINMDLIAGLTGDTAETFAQTVDTLLNLSPENITVHTLAIKRGADLTDKAAAAAQRETVSQMLDGASHALQNAGYGPYYLYRQKFMAGGFENVGWCKPGTECFYNVSMMEELQTILSLGAGGVSKRVVRETGWIERANNPKYPLEYIQAADRLANGKKKLLFPKK